MARMLFFCLNQPLYSIFFVCYWELCFALFWTDGCLCFLWCVRSFVFLFLKNKTSTPVVSKNIISHKFAIKEKMRHSKQNCTKKRIHHWIWANILNIFMNVKSATTKIIIDMPAFCTGHTNNKILNLCKYLSHQAVNRAKY